MAITIICISYVVCQRRLGISFLEEIVNRRKILDSGEILNELRNEIQKGARSMEHGVWSIE